MNSLLVTLQKIISFTIYWLAVPYLMFQLIMIGKSMVSRIREPERKLSAQAGWWAGLVLFAFFIIYQASSFNLSLPNRVAFSISIPGAISGFFASVMILWSLQSWLATKAIGLITMLLSFGGSICLYCYLFIRIYNSIILSATLGIVLGCLIYLIIFPKDLEKIFMRR